jgi:hypothetical protein
MNGYISSVKDLNGCTRSNYHQAESAVLAQVSSDCQR